jgi:hypothetical protein
MAVKTFTDSTSLPASDINAYLNNGGLVYVTSATIGTAVSSVVVSNCFSTTYDNYRVVVSGSVGSILSDNLTLRLGASTTGYYGVLTYATYAAAANLCATDNNASLFTYAGNANNQVINTSFDLLSPFLAKYTNIANAQWVPQNAAGVYNGIHQVATSYTGFTVFTLGSTMTGGTITVYGYRKA